MSSNKIFIVHIHSHLNINIQFTKGLWKPQSIDKVQTDYKSVRL